MGNHRNTTSVTDPLHGFLQACPAVWDITWFAFGEEFSEHFGRVAAHTGLNQVPSKVGARNQLRVAHILQGALVGVQDADFGQAV